MAVEQIEVFPAKDADSDEWYWHKRATNKKIIADGGEGYATRAAAIKAARKEGGGEPVNLVNEAGEVIGSQNLPTNIRIVLLRRDGSLVGELDPPPSSGGTPQHVTLTPAGENSEAGLDG